MIRKLGIGLLVLIAGAIAAIATISSSLNTVTTPGNGSQTAFTFPFVGVAASDISVVLTNSIGVQTTLAAGPGPTQYQITLNSAVSPALWGVGGTIIYNPSGTPIPSGSSLTITRTLPYTQLTSLQNQASFGQLASATEMALDQLEMQIQQVGNGLSRVLQGPSNDPVGLNYTLPSATARANTGIAFDSVGNVIAGTTPATGTISSAMQPVVNAASLATGRAVFGLGSAATGATNYGLQNGVSAASNIDVNFAPVADSINQTVTAAFHMTKRICTGPITYTLPRANTTWTGFGFWVYAVSGICTITPNAADSFLGVASGIGIAVPAGSWVYITTNAVSSATWWTDYHGATNTNLVAGVGSSALTITLNSGPLQFRDTTLANGDPIWSLPAINTAITISSTATLGTSSSNVPFRIWIFAAYNGGTPVLGVAICSATTSTTATVYPCAAWETIRKSGTAISVGATSVGTLYTSTGVTNDSVIIIGYADYATGLATAGTWATAPTTVQLCLPPRQCKKPGDIVQNAFNFFNDTTSYNSVTAVPTVQLIAITPSSSPNIIKFQANGVAAQTNDGASTTIQFWNGAALVGPVSVAAAPAASGATTLQLDWMTKPGVTTAITYTVYIKVNANASVYPNGGGTISAKEIMGALDPPANDNETSRKVA